jgi:putative oxygen-independent coproporphyrinogen III oxidase
MAAPYALYVHVPWCRRVCPYCDFNVYASAAVPEADDVAAYCAELAAWSERAEFRGRPIDTLHLGGGTPSLLSPDAVAAVLDAARRIGLRDGAEVTLEANPGTVTPSRLGCYRRAGVTRLSLGAQSFQPDLLRTLGRDHTPDDTRVAVAMARDTGFANVSLDLIFAVPGQSLAAWEDDVAQALALAPQHVSAYALTWEDGTPFHAWRARGRLVAVDDDLESAMAELVASRLAEAGFQRYEISSWARPGFASRHNTHYWDGSDYLGLGPGAHSFHAGPVARRWWNVRRPHSWRSAVAEHGTAVDGEERLSDAQARSDFVITGLRRIGGVDVGEFERRFATSVRTAFPQLLHLEREGLVVFCDATLRLTARGLRYADTVGALLV